MAHYLNKLGRSLTSKLWGAKDEHDGDRLLDGDTPEPPEEEEEEEPDEVYKVVRAVHDEYLKRHRKGVAYGNLCGFLLFGCFWFSVLFMERNATDAYAITNTVIDQFLPEDNEFLSSAGIFEWLEGTVGDIWTDPVCGDGTCEAPFEYPSYGRFGCRADCMSLQERYLSLGFNVSTMQIDLYYDFAHKKGSLSSTALMEQTSWNLCPQSGLDEPLPHGQDCYYESDQMFDNEAGHVYLLLDDVPDGDWELRIFGDHYSKVHGAIRSHDNVTLESTTLKVQIAYDSASLQLTSERTLYSSILESEMRKTDWDVLYDAKYNVSAPQRAAVWADWQAGLLNSTEYEAAQAALEVSVQADIDVERQLYLSCATEPDALFPPPPPFAPPPPPFALNSTLCSCSTRFNATAIEYMLITNTSHAVATLGFDAVAQLLAQNETAWRVSGSGVNASDTLDAAALPDYWCCQLPVPTDQCEVIEAELADAKAAWAARIRARLAQVDTQAAAVGTNNVASELQALSETNPVAYKEITEAYGTDPDFYRDASTETLWEANLDIERQKSAVKEFLEPFRLAFTPMQNLTDLVERRVAELTPGMIAENLGHIGTEYDGIPLEYSDLGGYGGLDEWKTCNMYYRGLEYDGFCPDYMRDDLQALLDDEDSYLDRECAALCTCLPPPPGSNLEPCSRDYCVCTACDQRFSKEEFFYNTNGYPAMTRRHLLAQLEERNTNLDQIATALVLAHGGYDEAHAHVRRRILEYTTDELMADLTAIAAQQQALIPTISEVRDAQTAQAVLLNSQYSDTLMLDTIDLGFKELFLKHTSLTELLQQALSLQQASNAALAEWLAAQEAAIAGAESALAMSNELTNLVMSQLLQIERTMEDGILSGQRAMELRWKAGLDEKVEEKFIALSTTPCSLRPRRHAFTVDNYPEIREEAARTRLVGTNNRVIAGLLLHTTRNAMESCPTEKFDKLFTSGARCVQGVTTEPFGSDPVFSSISPMYNSEIDNVEDMVSYYNCDEIENPTYNTSGISNMKPFCKELYNEANTPYAFFSYPIPTYDDGYPIFIDINLKNSKAMEALEFLREGLYVNSKTGSLSAQIVVYNADLDHFANMFVMFVAEPGGTIQMSYRIVSVRVSLYETTADWVRFAMEIILNLFVVYQIYSEGQDLLVAKREHGTYKAYFRSAWNYIDCASIAINVASCIIWWIYSVKMCGDFNAQIRYNVYTPRGGEGETDARLFNLYDGGSQMDDMAQMMSDMTALSDTLSLYMTLSGINVILYMLRVLKLMDFQPRLGVVTRSVFLAADDLFHFCILMMVIIVGFMMMAHLIFGHVISIVSTPSDSGVVMFEMMLGDVTIWSYINTLIGPEWLPGVIFFWAYNIVVVMILLNFFLAIICDAFSEVKGEASETEGMFSELNMVFREKIRSSLRRVAYKNHIPNRQVRDSLASWINEDPQALEEDVEEDYVEPDPHIIIEDDEAYIELDTEGLGVMLKKRAIEHSEKLILEQVGVKQSTGSFYKLKKKDGVERKKVTIKPYETDEMAKLCMEVMGKERAELLGDDADGGFHISATEMKAVLKEVLKDQQLAISKQAVLKEKQDSLIHALAEAATAAPIALSQPLEVTDTTTSSLTVTFAANKANAPGLVVALPKAVAPAEPPADYQALDALSSGDGESALVKCAKAGEEVAATLTALKPATEYVVYVAVRNPLRVVDQVVDAREARTEAAAPTEEEAPAPAEAEAAAPAETEAPAPAEEAPAPAPAEAEEEAPAPAEASEAPAEETPAPVEETPAPAEASEAPAEEAPASTEASEAPAEAPAPGAEAEAPAEAPAPAEES